MNIELKFCTLAHTEVNAQVEGANKTIKKILKSRLSEKKRTWVGELLGVLWVYWTTHKVSTRKTPFSLAFGHEAVIPTEIEMSVNYEQMCINMDLLVEKRELLQEKVAAY